MESVPPRFASFRRSRASRAARVDSSASASFVTCSPRWSSVVRIPSFFRARATAIPASRVSPATNRLTTVRVTGDFASGPCSQLCLDKNNSPFRRIMSDPLLLYAGRQSDGAHEFEGVRTADDTLAEVVVELDLSVFETVLKMDVSGAGQFRRDIRQSEIVCGDETE